MANLHNIISILILSQRADRLQNLIHHYMLRFWVVAVLKDSLRENCCMILSLQPINIIISVVSST